MVVLVISYQRFGDRLLGLLAACISMLGQDEGIHGDSGLELGTVGAAFAQLLRRRLRLRWKPPFRGGAPPQMLTMGAVQKSQTTSVQLKQH
jgi:hypothetical protein